MMQGSNSRNYIRIFRRDIVLVYHFGPLLFPIKVISRDEIDEKAQEFGLHVANVERDYVIGWLLSGLYRASNLAEQMVLTGGNCFRKAYFPTTRYSKDVDLSTPGWIDPHQILLGFRRICEYASDNCGVIFKIEETTIRKKKHAEGDRQAFQIRLYFEDFYGKPNSIIISVRVDVLEFAKIVLPIQDRDLIHPYSDCRAAAAKIRCLKLEELLADKLKCLLQRVHTADLFDFVYSVFVAKDMDVSKREIASTFLRKTIFGESPGAAVGLLLKLPFQLFREAWGKYIVCPSQSQVGFDSALDLFTSGLQQVFENTRQAGRVSGFFPADLRTPLLKAGREQTILKLEYDGFLRRVEPYSLVFKRRKDGVAREYLYVYDLVGGRTGPGLKCMIHPKIGRICPTQERFKPRFPIELCKAGEHIAEGYFGRPFGSRSRSRTRTSATITGARLGSGIVYTVECAYCGRPFRRSTKSRKMRPHRDPSGHPCRGRTGYLIDEDFE